MENCAENTVNLLWLVKLCQEPYAHSLLQKQHWCHSFWSNLFMTIRMKTKFQGLTNWCFAISWYCQQRSISWNKVIQICQWQACKIKLPVSKVSRTVKFWTPYIYFDVLKRFIIAEKTSNWSLHFESTLNILNLFISFDLISYAKSAINGI